MELAEIWYFPYYKVISNQRQQIVTKKLHRTNNSSQLWLTAQLLIRAAIYRGQAIGALRLDTDTFSTFKTVHAFKAAASRAEPLA